MVRGKLYLVAFGGLEVGQEPDGLQAHVQVGLGVGPYPGDLRSVGAAEPVPVAAVLGDLEGGPGLEPFWRASLGASMVRTMAVATEGPLE